MIQNRKVKGVLIMFDVVVMSKIAKSNSTFDSGKAKPTTKGMPNPNVSSF